MAVRRQVLSHDDWVHQSYYHQTTPRKWRTIGAWTMESAPSRWHQGRYIGPAASGLDTHLQNWTGKRLLYWQGESIVSYVEQIRNQKYGQNAISEYEIAMLLRPNIYRIVFVDHAGKWRSKPAVDYMANRLNILVDPNDIIRGFSYF